jgi:hypothetical protein
MAWFNKLNSRGEAIGDGRVWLTDDTTLRGINDNTATVIEDRAGTVLATIPQGFNRISSGGNRWIGMHAGTRTASLYRGSVLEHVFPETDGHLSRDGSRLAFLAPWNADNKTLTLEGVRDPIAAGPIMDFAVSSTAVCWMVHIGGGQKQTFVVDLRTGEVRDCSVLSWEGGPVPIDTPTGPWLLTLTQEPSLLLRPHGSKIGYRLPGIHHGPDAIWNDAPFRIVSNSDHGVTQWPTVTEPPILLGPLTPVPPPPPPPPDPPEPPTMPDVPNYIAHVQKRAAEFPDYTNDNLSDEQRIDAAAKLTAIVAYDIHHGVAGAPRDARVTLFGKPNKYGYDENRLFFYFEAENVCCFAKIVIQTGASWASIGWNETETFFPGGGDRRLIPQPVPGVHDGAPPPPSSPPTPDCDDVRRRNAVLESENAALRAEVQRLNGELEATNQLLATAQADIRDLTRRLHECQNQQPPAGDCSGCVGVVTYHLSRPLVRARCEKK